MATKIGDLYFEVSASTEKIAKSIAGIGGAARDSGNIISLAVGGAFVAAGIAATTALASITVGLAAVGAEFNAAGQRATGLFTALTGSAAEAVDLMREFAEISLDTPIFTTKALQDVARTLLAYGVAKDDVTELAVSIQSAATALGIGELGAHKLALALGQVKSRGFFSAEEARQLANYGVNAYQLIADAVGLTVSEVRELGKQKRLLSEDVLPILTDRLQETFGPVAQSLVNTLGVQVQGLKNTLTGVASALAEPFVGRTGGGAIVEFLAKLRAELDGVVTVGEDGTFQLGGALSGLTTITQALADGFLDLGDSIIDALGSFVGGGGLQSFADNVAGAIPLLVQATKEFASGAIEFFGELMDAAEPLVDPIKNLVLILGDFVINAMPAAADAVVNFVDAAAPIAAQLITATDAILAFASPVIVSALEIIADLFGDLAKITDDLAPILAALAGAWVLLNSAIVVGTGYMGALTLTLSPAAAAFLSLAAAVSAALAALGAYKSLRAGVSGDTGFLTEDVPFFVEPFQQAARFGFALGGGTDNLEAQERANELNRLLEEGTDIGVAYARALDDSGLSMSEFVAGLRDAELGAEATSFATIEYKKILDEIQQANVEAGIATSGMAANLFEARVAAAGAGGAIRDLSGAVEEDIDLMKELQIAAKAAWEEVDRLLRPSADVTVDDFFRELPKLAQDLTDALKEQEKHPGILGDLGVSGAEEAIRKQAREVIDTLVKTYGIGLDDVKALLDERGLGAVIEALGTITEETTKTVDPLIAKYGQLGATTEQLRDAVARLNDQRQTAIRAQIDQVEAALRDAKDAAVEARQAIIDFFTGGQPSGTQRLIDELIGDVGDIGSKIEAGLLLGGEQGAAAIRLALGDIQGQLAGIVTAGLEDGLTGQQIVDMLGPIGTVLGEEANQALNRISSLDWTEGFTPAAGAEIANLLASVLDPGAIQKLLNDAMGADAAVSGLEKQLEDLRAAADLDVVFSPEQVQGALDDIAAEYKVLETKPLVTPEAAQAVFDAIQDVLDDPTHELEAAIDKALITQQILDAAKDAENQVHLVFDSMLYFDPAGLSEAGAAAATEFLNAFNERQRQAQDEYAQSLGFSDANAMREALGPVVTNAMFPNVPFIPTVNVNNDILVQGSPNPIATATEVIAASSAAAGSGGSVPRTLQEIYGYVPATRTGAR